MLGKTAMHPLKIYWSKYVLLGTTAIQDDRMQIWMVKYLFKICGGNTAIRIVVELIINQFYPQSDPSELWNYKPVLDFSTLQSDGKVSAQKNSQCPGQHAPNLWSNSPNTKIHVRTVQQNLNSTNTTCVHICCMVGNMRLHTSLSRHWGDGSVPPLPLVARP